MTGAASTTATRRVERDLCFALRLDYLHPDRALQAEAVIRDGVALVTALEGQRDARFVLQTVARPDPLRPERGTLEVHLLVLLRRAGDPAARVKERAEELRDDLIDLLGAPPLRWSFSTVTSRDELRRALEPIAPTSFAEVVRREEPCAPTTWSTSVGFADRPPTRLVVRDLWSMWTFGPADSDPRRVASVLLAQESDVCVRVMLEPTELTAAERTSLEAMVMEVAPGLPAEGLQRTSLHTLEALLYLRPLFHVSYLVGGVDRLSRSLLSALGHAVSEPARHGPPQPVLQGGFAVVRSDDQADSSTLAKAFGRLSPVTPGITQATPGLERVRRLLGAWEAGNVFAIPVADEDGVPGLETLSIPELQPPLARLPRRGNRLGALVGHGGLPVLLSEEDRLRHTYVCGQTGTGKSTLLLNLAIQDIAAGRGVAVIDPHGDLAEALLAVIPDKRIDDVVLIDPADPVAVVGVNLLEAESEIQRDYLVEELSNMFYALFDPTHAGIVGPRFETMLRQAANLLMAQADTPASMLDIVTVFTDDAVRAHLTEHLTDPVLAEYWLGEMALRRSNEWQEVVSWFRSKFEIFRTSRLVRNVVGQAKSTISFGEIVERRRILIVNLSKGLLGEYNSALIGHIVFARLWAAALERASIPSARRSPFHVYIDEFQNITNDSLPSVLSEARKFAVGLTLANQFFTQIPELTRDAIMGNVGSRVTFRIGPKDAATFAFWLGADVHPDELSTLPNHLAVAALSDDGVPLAPLVMRSEPPMGAPRSEQAERVRARSREQWARPAPELDDAFFSRWTHVRGSIGAQAQARTRPLQAVGPSAQPTAEPSFVDGWLKKREQLHTPTSQTVPEPGEDDDD